MPTLSRTMAARTLAYVAVGAAAFTAYLLARAPTGRPDSALELVAVVSLLLLTLGWLLRRSARHLVLSPIGDLARQMTGLADNHATRFTPAALAELSAFSAAAERVRVQYVEALAELVRRGEALEQLRRAERPAALGRADAEQGQSHAGFRSGAVAAGDMIARLTPNLHWLAMTPALQQFLGWSLAELAGRSFLELVHGEDFRELSASYEQALATGEGHNIAFRIVNPSGVERHVQMDVLTRYADDGSPLHFRCHLSDVTDRILTERELRARAEQLSPANERLHRTVRDLERLKEGYRDLYHHAPVMYFSLDPAGNLVACNQTMLLGLGYTRDELFGQPYYRLLTAESRRRFQNDPAAYQQPGETQLEVQWLHKQGRVIDVLVRSVAVFDAEGRFLRSRSVAQDVTESKSLSDELRQQAERLRKANDDLVRINKELDDFTYVVSHDLKEPLRTIEAFSTILRQDYHDALGAEAKEYLGFVIQAGNRMSALIDDLLTLSRAGRMTDTLQACDLAEVLLQVQDDLADLMQQKGARVRLDGIPPAVWADPLRLRQLLSNLVSNGIKYNQSPVPEVVVGTLEGGSPDSAEVTVFVRDNGIGIDPRYHEQIFKVFRRLHRPEEYEGTGAGLAICQKIVEAHGGRIRVASEAGKGATFLFTLPRAKANEPHRPVVEPRPRVSERHLSAAG